MHKNAWRPQRQESSHSSEPVNPFTKIHRNNQPLKACSLSDEDKDTDCRQCGKEFPHRQLVRPFDIALSHKEKWLYTDKNNPGLRVPSATYTTKFYCADSGCVRARFLYFDPALYLDTNSVEHRLKDSHRGLLKRKLGYYTCRVDGTEVLINSFFFSTRSCNNIVIQN